MDILNFIIGATCGLLAFYLWALRTVVQDLTHQVEKHDNAMKSFAVASNQNLATTQQQFTKVTEEIQELKDKIEEDKKQSKYVQ